MRVAIAASRQNVERQTGGPFGAAIFDLEKDALVSIGVNLVTSANCSLLHAEIVAIMQAQRILGYYDLGSVGTGRFELTTSTEPCAMCLGAIPWSGIRRVVCGARAEDAEAIGFNEGCKPEGGVNSLNSYGIEVVKDVLRQEAAEVLRDYNDHGGEIYNPARSSSRN